MKKRKIIPIAILLAVSVALGSFAFVLFRPKTLEQLTGIQKEDLTQVVVVDGARKWVFDQPSEMDAYWNAMDGNYRFSKLDIRESLGIVMIGCGREVHLVTPEKSVVIELIYRSPVCEDVEVGCRYYRAIDCDLTVFSQLTAETAQPIS